MCGILGVYICLPVYLRRKVGRLVDAEGRKVARIVKQGAGQCMDGWKSGLICEVDGALTIEFPLTSIIPSIRKLRIAHKIPTL